MIHIKHIICLFQTYVHINIVNVNDIYHLPLSKRGGEFFIILGEYLYSWLLMGYYKVLLRFYKEP